jgi:hypothetical protein
MLWAFVACFCWSNSARAEITYELVTTDGFSPYLVISGEFDEEYDVEQLKLDFAGYGVKIVSFNSDGGDIMEAMKFGRAIRDLGLNTIQGVDNSCASACVYAFMGGIERDAAEGSLGVHRGIYSTDEDDADVDTAIEYMQETTGELIGYLDDMGANPALLRISLSVSHDDVRYLTTSEMEKYRITTPLLSVREVIDRPPVASTPLLKAQEEKARRFMMSYIENLGRNDRPGMAFWNRAYAGVVDKGDIEADGKTLKADVLKKRRQLSAEWPVRAYTLNEGIYHIICEDICVLEFSADWFQKNAAGTSFLSGVTMYSVSWNPRTEKITGEMDAPLFAEPDRSRPVSMLSRWERMALDCRKGDRQTRETKYDCDHHVALEKTLKSNGWCYREKGQSVSQSQWYACEMPSIEKKSVTYKAWHKEKPEPQQQEVVSVPKPRPLAPPQDFLEVTGTKVAVHDSKFDVPDREDFPATRYTGQTLKPDFRDRLADDKAAQTAVRTAMLRRPNFAGQYSLVDIKCSKNCSPFIVADHKSGVLIDLPGSNKQGDVRVDYRRDSRLLAVQSVDHQSKNCVLQYFTIDEDANGKSKWTSVKDITIGKPELCKHSIEKNLYAQP